jgi:hypothetical protein
MALKKGNHQVYAEPEDRLKTPHSRAFWPVRARLPGATTMGPQSGQFDGGGQGYGEGTEQGHFDRQFGR